MSDTRHTIVVLEGEHLKNFLELMLLCGEPFGRKPTALGLWFDELDGGLKVNIDSTTWSPSFGRVVVRQS